MDAVWNTGPVLDLAPSRRTDGLPVRERPVEGVELGGTSGTTDVTNPYAQGDAVLRLVRGSADQFAEMLDTAGAEHAAENTSPAPPGQYVDVYA
jgi:hypothetical protein